LLDAQERTVPTIVVTPLNHGAMDFVLGADEWDDPSKVARRVSLFDTALRTEIIPQVEALYRASTRREDRAIAGLSMGAYVGYHDLDAAFPTLSPRAAPELPWVSCTASDGGFPATQRFVAWLKAKGMAPTAVETTGVHNWAAWRDNLIHFAPLLVGPPAPTPQH
jgi:enterochelin esterase-like enzyme